MVLRLFALFVFLLPLSAQDNWLSAPTLDPKPINQLRTSGNACGPACLLDSFQCGSKKWQQSAEAIKGNTQRERLIAIIKEYAARPSKQFPKQMRWSPRRGINAVDLAAMANEMRTKSWMGTVKQEILFRKNREQSHDTLQRAHQKLSRSLSKGFPPIISVRRLAFRRPPSSQVRSWLTIKRHYVVVTGLPKKLAPGATSFPITYRDPWGGYSYKGMVKVPQKDTQSISTPILELPKSKIGKKLLRRGEATALSLSSAIGVF